jgi:predicted flap endonuclease-1-like 5' DNA nuclease
MAMDWMSLAIGAVIGGLVMWGVDVLLSTRRPGNEPTDEVGWRDKFEAAQAEAARYRAQIDNLQPSLHELESLRQESRIPALESEVRQLKSQIQEMEKARASAPSVAPTGEIAAAAQAVVEAAKPVYHGAEPLDKIVGIGEERKQKLYEHGILTFKQLAHASPEHVAQILGMKQDQDTLNVIYSWVEEAATLASEQVER